MTGIRQGTWSTFRETLSEPIDPAGLASFRIGFGLIAAFASVRFMALGWIDELLIKPSMHFSWIEGLETPDAWVLYGLFIVQASAGLAIAAGVAVRASLAAWLLSFGYVELLDKALYLNHYVLFSLLGLWLFMTPAHRARFDMRGAMPRWPLILLQVQVATVYLWAGIAKLNSDWLFEAEPLTTWLNARVDTPIIGSLFAEPLTAYVMSWSGMVYDLSIPLLLLWTKTRRLGVLLVLVFHLMVGMLFPIGIFPALMVLGATLFLSPSWPRRMRREPWQPLVSNYRISTVGALSLCALCCLISLFPGRSYLNQDDTSWSERGYRFSWRVLLNEKTGLVDYRVLEPATGREWRAYPRDGLSDIQHQQMRTQPDLIRDYALYLQAQHAREGRVVEVYADSFASLNGRRSQRFIDPNLDLTQPIAVLDNQGWILPLLR